MDIEVVMKPDFTSDNYYEVLGCTSSASDNKLTEAYRDLSRKVCRQGSRLSMVWRPIRSNGSPLPPASYRSIFFFSIILIETQTMRKLQSFSSGLEKHT
jgi:hypothetical protein